MRTEKNDGSIAETDRSPRMEPWLATSLWSFVPILIALFVPKSFQIPLLVAGGVVLVIGMMMMIAHERRAQQDQSTQ